MPDTLRVVVLGAGAIGCFIGGQWLAAGIDMRFVGRDHIAERVAQHGLTLTDFSGWSWHCDAGDIDFQTRPEALDGADLVVLAVKGTGLGAAAQTIAQHAPAGATVLSLLNGVRAKDELAASLPQHNVIAGMVPFNVAALGGGRWHRGSKGQVRVQRNALTQSLAQRLAKSPGRLRLENDMTPVLWGKLLLNLNNPVNALSGLTLHEELSQRGYRRVFAASVREALNVLRAAGITPARVTALPAGALPAMLETPDWVFRNTGLRLQKIDRTARSSMADDLGAGRKTEIDHLNGEIVALAESRGLKAPVNACLMGLIKQAEEDGLRPVAPGDLARATGIRN